jgi:hypothetical protein
VCAAKAFAAGLMRAMMTEGQRKCAAKAIAAGLMRAMTEGQRKRAVVSLPCLPTRLIYFLIVPLK